ncbi:MAG: glycosyltransferase [Chloroflexota bacterium]|nr:MAG: glycosyltransferase [Chloroflexota bacterium]
MSSPQASGPGWIVIREGRNQRWGGELRRRQIFSRLAERTDARVIESGWYPNLIRRAAFGDRFALVPGPLLRFLPGPQPRPRFAASEKLRDRLLDAAIAVTDPAVVAVYDDPVAQSHALGVNRDPAWLAEVAARQRRNVEAFRWQVVPTRSFAELANLDLDRVIVGGNGTDVQRIRVGPWPDRPVVGLVSGAAPGRGIETLVDAVAAARIDVPEIELWMWLIATGDDSARYLDGLRSEHRDHPWVHIGDAAHGELGEALAHASILCIPHPPNDYMDVALPVKLFDSLAAGRPILVTPRTETAAIVRGLDVGVVSDGDRPDDLAEAIVELIGDPDRMYALGARARLAAEERFDWRIVGDRIADAVLSREGGSGPIDAAAAAPAAGPAAGTGTP